MTDKDIEHLETVVNNHHHELKGILNTGFDSLVSEIRMLRETLLNSNANKDQMLLMIVKMLCWLFGILMIWITGLKAIWPNIFGV